MSVQGKLVFVAGATGHQGGAVAAHLLERGAKVRAMTRRPDSPEAQALASRGAEIVEGDLDNQDSLDRAMDGAWGAYSVQPVSSFDEEVRRGETLANAAQEAGIQHFVYSSVGGAERNTGIPHFDSKWRIEEHIRKTGLPHVILRPVFFMNNWSNFADAIRGGTLPQPLRPDTKLQQIAATDIGAFAAMAFDDWNTWRDRAYELAGDERSMAETAAAFSRGLGTPVEYQQIPWDAFEDQAGAEMATMYRWFESDGYRADIAALRKDRPSMLTLDDYIAQDWI